MKQITQFFQLSSDTPRQSQEKAKSWIAESYENHWETDQQFELNFFKF